VQEQLGHATIELTVSTYGRWLKKKAPGALDQLDFVAEESRGSKVVAEADFAAGSVRTPPSARAPYIHALTMEPAIRIERTTCGLRIARRPAPGRQINHLALQSTARRGRISAHPQPDATAPPLGGHPTAWAFGSHPGLSPHQQKGGSTDRLLSQEYYDQRAHQTDNKHKKGGDES
jgi:hypothetical protein